jgi:hypothetical protein
MKYSYLWTIAIAVNSLALAQIYSVPSPMPSINKFNETSKTNESKKSLLSPVLSIIIIVISVSVCLLVLSLMIYRVRRYRKLKEPTFDKFMSSIENDGNSSTTTPTVTGRSTAAEDLEVKDGRASSSSEGSLVKRDKEKTKSNRFSLNLTMHRQAITSTFAAFTTSNEVNPKNEVEVTSLKEIWEDYPDPDFTVSSPRDFSREPPSSRTSSMDISHLKNVTIRPKSSSSIPTNSSAPSHRINSLRNLRSSSDSDEILLNQSSSSTPLKFPPPPPLPTSMSASHSQFTLMNTGNIESNIRDINIIKKYRSSGEVLDTDEDN